MKRWKLLACMMMVCAMIVSMVGCGGDSGDTADTGDTAGTEDTTGGEATGEQVVWRLAHTCTEDIALHQAAVMLADTLAEKTDGQFVLEIYANSALGGNREALEGMQFGTIQATIPNVGMLGGYSDSVSALELPFLIQDVDSFDGANAVLNTDVMDPIKEELEAAGFLWMGSWYQGNRHLTTTDTPVHSPADMQGLKIRTMESEIHMAAFNAMGANAVPMAFSEVFTALQQGALDGQENPYCNIYTQGMHEVQGYVIETAHIFDVVPLLVAKSAYDALPAEWQQLLTDEINNLTMTEWEMSRDQNEEYKQMIIDAGTTEIIELTPEERQAFRDAVQPVYDQYAPSIGEDFMQELQDVQEQVAAGGAEAAAE